MDVYAAARPGAPTFGSLLDLLATCYYSLYPVPAADASDCKLRVELQRLSAMFAVLSDVLQTQIEGRHVK